MRFEEAVTLIQTKYPYFKPVSWHPSNIFTIPVKKPEAYEEIHVGSTDEILYIKPEFGPMADMWLIIDPCHPKVVKGRLFTLNEAIKYVLNHYTVTQCEFE